ncbi:MAG: branched-chain amino acid ABC transporter permease [Deltaproteobacteria bacterium]|nr:branched-chain amino acid ABC transporter permease [Deltaproteobacteria bacterium]
MTRRLAILVAVVGALWLFDWWTGLVNDYVVRIIVLCAINTVLATSLNLINGTTGQFSIGHAGFMAVGAYGTAFTVVHVDHAVGRILSFAPPWASDGATLVVGLVAGAIFAAIAGLVVGIPSLRLKGDYLAIVTLGFGEVIRLVFNNIQALGGQRGYDGGRSEGLPILTTPFWVMALAILTVAVMRNIKFSTHGRALAAIREDEIAAEAMGVDCTRYKVLSFVVSSAFAGVAGGLFAMLQGAVNPNDFKFDTSIQAIIMIIVGGLGSVSGAILGAVFYTVMLEALRGPMVTIAMVFGYSEAEAQGAAGSLRLMTFSLMLVVMMILRPQGILGQRELDPRQLWRFIARRPS